MGNATLSAKVKKSLILFMGIGLLFSTGVNAFSSLEGVDKDAAQRKSKLAYKHETKELETRVLYLERKMLPPGSEVTVSLVDVAKLDVPADIIASQSKEIKGAPPYKITLNYDPDLIKDSGQYVLKARIENKGELLFMNTKRVDAFAGKSDKPVEILVTNVVRRPVHQIDDGDSLLNTRWVLMTLGDKAAVVGENEQEVSMILSFAERKISGFSGCNNFSGKYDLHHSKVNFEKMMSTQKMCMESMDQEQAFFEMLSATDSYKVKNDILTLFDANEVPLAQFTAQYIN